MSGTDDRVPVTVEEWAEEADSDEGIVVNWFVREGASVEAEESLCEIQIEKVSIDVLAPVSGALAEIVKREDDEFERGDTLAWITPDA